MDVLQDAGVAVDQDEQHPAVGAGIGPALPAPAPREVQRRAVRRGEAAVIGHRLTRACEVERQQPGRVPLALQVEVPAKNPRAERVGRWRHRALVGLDDLPEKLDHPPACRCWWLVGVWAWRISLDRKEGARGGGA